MVGIRITKNAENAKVDNCEFINTSVETEGANTQIVNSRFIKILSQAKDWSRSCLGQFIIGVAIAIVAGFLLNIFGIK